MVNKRKNPKDQWLPPRVYRGKTSYEWHPQGGGSVTLCKLAKEETPTIKARVWAEYKKATDMKEAPPNVGNLLDDYFASPQYLANLSVRTQSDYLGYSKRVRNVFGKMIPKTVRPHHIRTFMDKLGEKHPVSANRHHSFLSVVFGWALERNIVIDNPAKSVRKFKEKPRDVYPVDEQYWFLYDLALKSGTPYIAPMLELGYLCRLRPVETRRLTEFDLREDGIFINRTKGSNNEITLWSPRLREAVRVARSLYPDAPTSTRRPLVRGRDGLAVKESTYKTAMTRLKKQAKQMGVEINFTIHDIKAKGITDHPEKAGGHNSEKMRLVYDRLPSGVSSTK